MCGNSSRIAEVELLKYVPEPLRTQVKNRMRGRIALKGNFVVNKNTRSDDVYFVSEGCAEAVMYSESGREVFVHEVGPGDVFGEFAALDGKPRSADVTASCELRLQIMTAKDFRACVASSPEAAAWLAQKLVAGVRRLTTRVFELSALNVPTRIRCELYRLALTGQSHGGDIVVRNMPTHKKIANRVGTDRTAVTRELRALKKMNIIRYGTKECGKGNLHILNVSPLERAAEA